MQDYILDTDLTEMKSRFHEFFTGVCKSQIEQLLLVYPEKKSLLIEFGVLERYDPHLAEKLLEQPDIVIESAEQAINEMKLTLPSGKKFFPHLRFVNLPFPVTSQKINAEMINRYVSVKGFVTSISPSFPVNKIVLYQCQVCDSTVRCSVTKNFEPPTRCDSCKKLAIREVPDKAVLTDVQEGNVCSLTFRVADDLVNSVFQDSYAIFNGILRARRDIKNDRLKMYLDVNSIEMIDKRVNFIDDLPEDVVTDIDAFDAYPKASRGRTPIPADVKREVLERDAFKCKRCGVSWSDAPLEIDHIIPVASGAENVNDIKNLQALCRTCNRMKSASLPFGFARKSTKDKDVTKQETLDIDTISMFLSKEEKERFNEATKILSIIKERADKDGSAKVEDVVKEAGNIKIEERTVKRIIGELLRRGDIYEITRDNLKIIPQSASSA